MAEAFDPYHQWMGIPPDEQPPNHYRLLAIELFESDAEVITNAADLRMAHIRTFQAGEHADLSQEIRNRVAAARVCLLDPQKKERYDRQLAKPPTRTSAEPRAADEPAPAAVEQPDEKPRKFPPWPVGAMPGKKERYDQQLAQPPTRTSAEPRAADEPAPAAVEQPDEKPRKFLSWPVGAMLGIVAVAVIAAAMNWMRPGIRELPVAQGPTAPLQPPLKDVADGMGDIGGEDSPMPHRSDGDDTKESIVPFSLRGPSGQPSLLPDQTSLPSREQSLPFSAGTDPPTAPLAELPRLEEVAPLWIAVNDSRSAAIRSARTSKLRNLSEEAWASLLWRYGGMPPMPPPSRGGGDPRQFDPPQRFILTGELAGLRVEKGKSVVYLQPSMPGREIRRPPDQFRMMLSSHGGPICPVAAVELPTDRIGLWMSDYKAGDRLRVVVSRHKWGTAPQAPPGYPPGRMPPSPLKHIAEFRPLFAESHYPCLCWCFRGEGIEKAGQPDTWIDPRLGRAGTLTNAAAVGRCPTLILRSAPVYRGASARVTARFSRVTRRADELLIYLTIAENARQPISVVGHFRGAGRWNEFLGYRTGGLVEATITVREPRRPSDEQTDPGGPGGRFPPEFRAMGISRDPLPYWPTIDVNVGQIQIEGDPSTLVDVRRPRSTSVAISPDSPDVAHVELGKVLGKEATWSGTLDRLRRRNGETHLMVRVSGSVVGLRYFEAYTIDIDFFDNLADYVDGYLSSADKVSVTGTIVSADAAAYRLYSSAPMLRIKRVQRDGDPDSLAEVGRKRLQSTLRQSTIRTGMASLLRDWPPVGAEKTFTGYYNRFSSSGVVYVMDKKSSSRDHVKAAFPGAKRDDFADYRRNDAVEVTVTVTKHASNLEMLGKSIVKSTNPLSRVTDKGRQTPAMDFSDEKSRWGTIKRNLSSNTHQSLRGAGYFGGYSGGPRSYKITVKKLFFSYGDLRLNVQADGPAAEFLQQLKDGEEVLFEFSPTGGSYSRPEVKLVWMSRIGEPGKRVSFSAP